MFQLLSLDSLSHIGGILVTKLDGLALEELLQVQPYTSLNIAQKRA